MRVCGNALEEGGRAYRQRRTSTEETSGNAGYPDDPLRHLRAAEGVTGSPHKSPNNKSIRVRILFAAPAAFVAGQIRAERMKRSCIPIAPMCISLRFQVIFISLQKLYLLYSAHIRWVVEINAVMHFCGFHS